MRFLVLAMIAGSLSVPLTSPRAAPGPHQARVAATNAASASSGAEEGAPVKLGPLTSSEKQGYGCMVAGGAALSLLLITGATPMIGLFTGVSGLPPQGTLEVGLAVTGTIFASTCAVGALVAPTAVRLWRYYYEGAEIEGESP